MLGGKRQSAAGWMLRLFGGLVAVLAPSLCLAVPPTLQLSASVDYSIGHYGQSPQTEAIIEPLTAKISLDDWVFRGTLPFASIRGPADVSIVSDDIGAESQDAPSEEQNEGGGSNQATGFRSGLSDISLAVSRQFNGVLARPLYLETTARVRLPTGSRSRGLGVGATDYFLNAEFGGDWKPGGAYVALGRRFLGAVPGTDRHDGWQGSAGGWLNTGPNSQIGAGYSWRQSSFVGASAYQAVEGYVSYRLSPKIRIQIFAGTGLSRNSPAFDAGVMFIFRTHGPLRQTR